MKTGLGPLQGRVIPAPEETRQGGIEVQGVYDDVKTILYVVIGTAAGAWLVRGFFQDLLHHRREKGRAK